MFNQPRQQKKLKILAYCDSPTVATGFGTVAKNIFTGLYETGKYDIDIFAINYWGSPAPPLTQVFNIWPAGLNSEHDPYGRKKFMEMAKHMEFDILFFLQDSFILQFLTEYIPQLKAQGKKFVSLCYYPCDSIIKKSWAEAVTSVDIPVAYTQFAKDATLLALGDTATKKNIRVIYHGVNDKDFYPRQDQEAVDFRKRYFGPQADKFIFCNLNRNQQRKDIPRFIRAYKQVKETNSNVLAYCHMAVRDQGWRLDKVCEVLGLSTKTDVVFPQNFGPNQGYPVPVVNILYNSCDCVVSTALGEGFGLCICNHSTIYTEEGLKEIGDITIQDKVLSDDGTYNKVRAIMSRDFDGDLYEITTWLSNIPLKTSPEHGFKVFENGEYIWKKAENLKIGDNLLFPKKHFETKSELDIYDIVTQTLNARQILNLEETGDMFRLTSNFIENAGIFIPKKIKITKTLMRLFGLYLAEGCVSASKKDSILFSFNKKETNIIEFVANEMKKVFGLNVYYTDNKSRGNKYGCQTIRFYSSVVANLFYNLFDHGARNKKIPSILLNQPLEYLIEFVNGEFIGDGCYCKTDYEMTFSTTSKHVAYGLRLILAKLGILSSVRTSRVEYKVNVSGISKRKLLKMFNIEPNIISDRVYNGEKCSQNKKYLLLPIKTINKVPYRGTLVDIQVENTNNFVAENMIVHNSWIEGMATKKPVIMPNNTMIPELINDDIAYLVDSGTNENLYTILPNDNEVLRPLVDIDHLVKVMNHVINNPEEAKEKAEAAYKYVINNLTWERSIVPKWINLFNEASNIFKSQFTVTNTEVIKPFKSVSI